jgi:hypothetical protein
LFFNGCADSTSKIVRALLVAESAYKEKKHTNAAAFSHFQAKVKAALHVCQAWFVQHGAVGGAAASGEDRALHAHREFPVDNAIQVRTAQICMNKGFSPSGRPTMA